jgi:hypothetical protein
VDRPKWRWRGEKWARWHIEMSPADHHTLGVVCCAYMATLASASNSVCKMEGGNTKDRKTGEAE